MHPHKEETIWSRHTRSTASFPQSSRRRPRSWHSSRRVRSRSTRFMRHSNNRTSTWQTRHTCFIRTTRCTPS
ncbi:hypothetical protein RSA11_04535 [Exiguobacterium indicum]|uniref:Uncharacterized protein n=1 Tax=Exiguobacterium indicum TaxID=296995 RepID=A0AAW3MG89_9BACL|nr:hypothetical protein RSA11_04535 [Exiguobacterium indicum]